jgi:hypothetical protein
MWGFPAALAWNSRVAFSYEHLLFLPVLARGASPRIGNERTTDSRKVMAGLRLSNVHESVRLCRLREFNGRDRPFAIMASNSDPQSVHFIQQKVLDRAGLSVGEDHGFANKLGLGMFKFLEDRGRMVRRSWHG